MLDKYRQKADKFLEPFAGKIDIKPTFLTYFSLLFAIFAGIFSFFSYNIKYFLILSAIFIIINGFLDALDGKIARMRGEASKKGDFIDHAIDRFSDVFIIGGIALSPWINKSIGIITLSCILLVSYLGTQAQAVGYKRIYAGILGRADRILILFFSLIIQFFVRNLILGFHFLEWVFIYFIVASIVTIIQRYYLTIKVIK